MTRARTIRQSVVAIGDSARPEAGYAFPRTYVVRNGRTDGKLDLDPPPDVPNLKGLAAVPVWSLAGSAVQALPGDRVVVIFRDADPTRAIVIGFEPLTTGRHPVVAVDATSLHLGGTIASTDPAALRASDTGGKYAFDPGVPSMLGAGLYYLPPGGSAYVPVTPLPAGSTVGGTVLTLPSTTPGTSVVLGPGSTKVTVG